MYANLVHIKRAINSLNRCRVYVCTSYFNGNWLNYWPLVSIQLAFSHVLLSILMVWKRGNFVNIQKFPSEMLFYDTKCKRFTTLMGRNDELFWRKTHTHTHWTPYRSWIRLSIAQRWKGSLVSSTPKVMSSFSSQRKNYTTMKNFDRAGRFVSGSFASR